MGTLEQTHDDLISVSTLLGLLAESAQWYTQELAIQIHAGAVPVWDMTAREIAAVIDKTDTALGLPTKTAPEVVAPTTAEGGVPTPAIVVYRLRALAAQMRRVGADMDYLGGFGPMAEHGREMRDAADMADEWADELEGDAPTGTGAP